jgi:hypothetical protein
MGGILLSELMIDNKSLNVKLNSLRYCTVMTKNSKVLLKKYQGFISPREIQDLNSARVDTSRTDDLENDPFTLLEND